MPRHSQYAQSVVAFFNAANARADEEARPFLERPMREWPNLEQLGCGTLRRLLSAAREEFDRRPRRALDLTTLVLHYVDRVSIPEEFSLQRILLRGTAWKEHATALQATGDLQGAVSAAERAVEILSAESVLQVDRAAARMTQAVAAYELGRTDDAKRWLEECRPVFEYARESGRLLQLQMIEGHILFHLQKFADARDVFLSALSAAETLGKGGERARILNNIGQCAVRLKDLPQAITYLTAAREAVESEGLTTAREKVFWGFGCVLREQGDLHAAVDLLRKVVRGLLANGSVVDAATAGLDLVELLSAIDEKEKATRMALEIVDVFSKAGIQNNVRKALAYLTEGATAPGRVPLRLDARIRHLRSFFIKLKRNPMAGFRIPRSAAVALSAR